MAGSVVAPKRNIECRTKVKTGCATCRIRKVKCDENKPFCQKCVNTGRTCDGSESPFRFFTSQPINNTHAGGIKSDVGLQPIRPTFIEIAPQDIDLLNRYFSTKTMFDVKLGCDEEARQVLQASLTDPPIRHAVLSLRALREDLETSGDGPASVAQQTPSYHYGLQQYGMALGGLASNLSSPGSNGLKSALLCCQIFISIEQVQKNYAAMAQHIIRGLRIMHEYRARPDFVAANKLVPAHHDQLPFLDVFIIKLFAAPCKFADPPATADDDRHLPGFGNSGVWIALLQGVTRTEKNCGDVLTKKKLDAHHRQCQGSSFTCLDCLYHFRGTEYRTHTSCVSEAQKYQGALYKEKPSKEGKKSVKRADHESQRPRKAYVEDALDSPTPNAISIVSAPPPAPTPPSAIPPPPVNVFDFLVTGDTPNASKISLAEPAESMKTVVEHTQATKHGHTRDRAPDHESYEKRGYMYGEGPVPLKKGKPEIEYYTPAPKHFQNGSRESLYVMDDSQKKSTDKKRKRLHVEELDLTEARRPSQERDLIMSEAPPAVLHSGLTGGLNRLLSKSNYPPSPDYSNGDPSPPSPAKRSRKTITITNETTKEKDRTRKEKDRGRKASSQTGQLVRIRKRRSSDESRPHKQHRSHHSPDRPSRHDRPKHKAIEDRPKRKAIEYHTHSDKEDSQKQLMVNNSRAELFLSFVTKGPESEQGYSVHKALKRYHRERDEQGLGLEKESEEKELFKGLRLKKNDRGEVVLFF